MFKRTVAAIVILAVAILCLGVKVEAAKPKQNPADAIQFLAESYVFGTGEDSAAENFLTTTLKDFPLSSMTAERIKSAYAEKLQSGMTIKTTLKKNDAARPVVTVTTTPINVASANTNDLLVLKVNAVMGVDNAWQSRALRTIGKFIDELSFRKAARSFDVTCVRIEGDDGNSYWVTEDPIAFQNFLVPNFELRSTAEIKEFLGVLGNGLEPSTSPVKPPTKPEPVKPDTPSTGGDKWLIYWYVCGTDIETNYGNMTRSIQEVESSNLNGNNVKILMQLGGTENWHHLHFQHNNGQIGRYLYEGNGWQQRGALVPINDDPKTQMNAPECLADFLKLGQEIEKEIYPEGNVRRVFIFDNHGGGSLNGICKDPYSGGNMLGLKEMQEAFGAVGGISTQNPQFEIVAFDACLMSTYETAVALEGIARYMVASQEETNTYVGLGYTDLLNVLSEKPAMDAKTLAENICDTYWQDAINTDNKYSYMTGVYNNSILTSSVIDLSQIPNVRAAYEEFGAVARNYAQGSSNMAYIVTGFNRASKNSERYPSYFANVFFNVKNPNSPAWLVDLRCFAENIKRAFPNLDAKEDALIAAINNAVVYEKRGELLNQGGGLSTYYPFELMKSENDIKRYEKLAENNLAPTSQAELYNFLYAHRYALPTQNLVPDTPNNENVPANTAAFAIPAGSPYDLSDFPEKVKVRVDKTAKTARIKLDKKQMERISGVRCQVAWFNYYEDEDLTEHVAMLLLGSNTDIKENWNSGDFESNFNGKWLTINGMLVYVQVISDSTSKDAKGNKISGSELCAVPIMLNERQCILLLSCSYPDETYRIIGARPVTDNGLPSGELYGLNLGDVIKPVYVRIKASEDDMNELEEKYGDPEKWTESQKQEIAAQIISLYQGKSITIDDTFTIEKRSLPNGNYAYAFEFVNPIGGNNSFTNFYDAIFKVTDGKISKVKHGDEVNAPEDLKN